jgi:hypothetical protein
MLIFGARPMFEPKAKMDPGFRRDDGKKGNSS